MRIGITNSRSGKLVISDHLEDFAIERNFHLWEALKISYHNIVLAKVSERQFANHMWVHPHLLFI